MLSRVVRAAGAGSARIAVGLLPPAGRGDLPRPVTDYKAPNFWLHYGFGFVRRALPGDLLRRVSGGSPTYEQMETAAGSLSRAAALSVVPLAVQFGRRAAGRAPRVVTAALLLLSPLTTNLLLHDTGRYDGVGVLVLAGLALGRRAWPHLPLPATVGLLAGAVSIAAASEEFLFAVVAPSVLTVAVRAARRRRLSPRTTVLLVAGTLAPGAVITGASLLLPAPPDAILAARAEAARAGVGRPGPMGDALSALERSFTENLGFARLFEPAAFAESLLLWAGLYAVTTSVFGWLLRAGSAYRSVASIHAVVGAALSVAGVDFRRWWGLSLLGVVSTIVLLEPPGPGEPPPPQAVAAAAALALAGLLGRDTSVHPLGRLRLERRTRRTG